MARNGASDGNQVFLCINFYNLEILNGNLFNTHMASHAHAFSDVLRETLANGTNAAGLVVAVGHGEAVETVALHGTGEAAAFTNANGIYYLTRLESADI